MVKMNDSNNVKIDKKREQHFFNMLTFFISHPDMASEHLLGIKLSPHERIITKAIFSGKEVDVCAGRAMAKTFTMSINAILMALLLSGIRQKMGAWSGSNYRGGKIIFEDYINKFINGEFLGQDKKSNYVIEECHSWHKGISFKNKQDHLMVNLGKTDLITSPMNDNIRGWRAVKIFLDERNTCEEAIIDKVVNPFSYHEQNVHGDIRNTESMEFIKNKGILGSQVISVGTPTYEEVQWSGKIARLMRDYKDSEKIQEIIDKNEHIFFHINFMDAFMHRVNVPKILKDLENPNLPMEEIVAEIFGYPIVNSSQKYYSNQTIRRIDYSLTRVSVRKGGEIEDSGIENEESEDITDNSLYSLGVDCAYGGQDMAALVLTKLNKDNGTFDIVNTWEYDTSKVNAYEKIAKRIKKLTFDNFPQTLVAITYDTRGGGDTLKRELYKTSSDYPVPIILNDEKDDDVVGKRILYGFNASDRTNTEINDFVKAKMQIGIVRIPDFNILNTSKNKKDKEKASLFKKIVDQFKMIVRKPTKNYFSFDVPSGKHKDSYSATLYSFAYFCFDEYKLEKKKTKKRKCLARTYRRIF